MRMSLPGLDTALVLLLLTITTATGTECKTRYGFGPPCLFPYRYRGAFGILTSGEYSEIREGEGSG